MKIMKDKNNDNKLSKNLNKKINRLNTILNNNPDYLKLSRKKLILYNTQPNRQRIGGNKFLIK